VYFGPCLHFWYSKYLPKCVALVYRGGKSKLLPALIGMGYDQLAFAPCVLSGFFIFLNITKKP
jgi:hypothetical protein